MATLRLTLLVVTLLGLMLLAASGDVDASLVRTAYDGVRCNLDWRACCFHNQRCAECTKSCKTAQKTTFQPAKATLMWDRCRQATK